MGRRARLKKMKKASHGKAGAADIFPPSPAFQKVIYILPFILCAAVFLFGVGLRFQNLDITSRSPDEGTYVSQARTFLNEGFVKGVRLLIDEHNRNPDLWIYPPPTRIGYLYVLAGVMKMTNISSEMAGTYLSCACSIVILCLMGVIALRFFNPWVALAALFFMSISPMDLAIARRCWTDEMFALLAVSMVYFCCEIARKPRPVWYALFWIVSAYFLLMKELAAVFYGLCVIWLIGLALFKERSIPKTILVIVISVVAAGASAFILIQVSGGLPTVLNLLKHVKEAIPTNQYALDYQAGPWYTIFAGFWILSPAVSFLSLLGIACAAAPKRFFDLAYEETGAYNAIWRMILAVTAAFVLAVVVIPYSHNLRYISSVFAPFYIMSGLGLWWAISFVRKFSKGPSFYLVIAIVVIGVVTAGVIDYKNFEHTFIKKGIPDLSIRLLKENARQPII